MNTNRDPCLEEAYSAKLQLHLKVVSTLISRQNEEEKGRFPSCSGKNNATKPVMLDIDTISVRVMMSNGLYLYEVDCKAVSWFLYLLLCCAAHSL